MSPPAIAALVVRCGLVLLFLPFSALDKMLGFNHARSARRSRCSSRGRSQSLVLLCGLAIEIVCTLGVVTGIADRACALVHRGLLRRRRRCSTSSSGRRATSGRDPDGKGRSLFWDFLKNLSLGAGFLLLVVGTDGTGLAAVPRAPVRLQPSL